MPSMATILFLDSGAPSGKTGPDCCYQNEASANYYGSLSTHTHRSYANCTTPALSLPGYSSELLRFLSLLFCYDEDALLSATTLLNEVRAGRTWVRTKMVPTSMIVHDSLQQTELSPPCNSAFEVSSMGHLIDHTGDDEAADGPSPTNLEISHHEKNYEELMLSSKFAFNKLLLLHIAICACQCLQSRSCIIIIIMHAHAMAGCMVCACGRTLAAHGWAAVLL